MIPYGCQDITQEDIDAVIGVLKSRMITQGPLVPEFENRISDFVGASHGVAVNSGSSALHLACLGLGLESQDLVWTSPISFVASANAALYCGANIDFVDIDEYTWNISVDALEEKLLQAKKNNKLPTIVITVDFAGQPVEQEKIWELSKEYGFKLIEDASHALGARRNKVAVGSCRWSDITTFSFHPVKMITTGEGGMAMTNDDTLAKKIRLLRSHGVTRDKISMSTRGNGDWYYEQVELGYNYRITDIQAALGISQMHRLEEYVSKRNQLAERYNKKLANYPVKLPMISEGNYSSFHLYIVKLDDAFSEAEYEKIFLYMKKNNIGVNKHYIPIYLQPYYKNMGFQEGLCPKAENYYHRAMTLPLYPGLTFDEQDFVIDSLNKAFNERDLQQ